MIAAAICHHEKAGMHGPSVFDKSAMDLVISDNWCAFLYSQLAMEESKVAWHRGKRALLPCSHLATEESRAFSFCCCCCHFFLCHFSFATAWDWWWYLGQPSLLDTLQSASSSKDAWAVVWGRRSSLHSLVTALTCPPPSPTSCTPFQLITQLACLSSRQWQQTERAG